MPKATLYLAMSDGRERDEYDYCIMVATFDKAEAEKAIIDYCIAKNVAKEGEKDGDLREWQTVEEFEAWRKGRSPEQFLRWMNDFSCIVPDLVTKEVELPNGRKRAKERHATKN